MVVYEAVLHGGGGGGGSKNNDIPPNMTYVRLVPIITESATLKSKATPTLSPETS